MTGRSQTKIGYKIGKNNEFGFGDELSWQRKISNARRFVEKKNYLLRATELISMMMMFISQLDLKSSNANIVCAPLQKICPFSWFFVSMFQFKWKCSRHRDSRLVVLLRPEHLKKDFATMAIQTSSLTVMVKRKRERICSPSTSSSKKSTCPQLSSEDYSPSSCFASPKPSRRPLLCDHFDFLFTLLVESPKRNCRNVSFTEVEFEWLHTVSGKQNSLASISRENRHYAILKYAEDMHFILKDIPESPEERQPEDAQVFPVHNPSNSLCWVPPRRWRLYPRTLDLIMNPRMSRRHSSRESIHHSNGAQLIWMNRIMILMYQKHSSQILIQYLTTMFTKRLTSIFSLACMTDAAQFIARDTTTASHNSIKKSYR